jgi:hypothetical protein
LATVAEDIDMEDVDEEEDGEEYNSRDEDDDDNQAMAIDFPPLSVSEKGGPPDTGIEEDEDEDWEEESYHSDASSEAFGDEEDEIVPPSFNLPAWIQPPSEDYSPSGLEAPEPPLQPEDVRVDNSSSVYGTDSKHLHVLLF